MIKTRILALALLAFAVSASAAVVSPETAAQAVRTWARRGGHFRGRMGKDVERTVRHETDGGFFYAVKMKGGGTVFTSGDDETEPVIAFTTGDGDFSKIDRGSPLWALLNGDARGRRRAPARHRRTWRRLARENDSGSDEPVAFAAAGTSPARTAVSDLRVDALVKSKWGQHSGIWNYYTPEVDGVRCYCGCVATATAQIMRYFHGPVTDGGLGIPFPLAEVPPKTFVCWVNDVHTELKTQGGTYAWDNMPLVPKAAGFTPTEAQKQNIGKLTSDVGICLWMSYHKTNSGTYLRHVPGSLINYWGYKQAVLYSLDGGLNLTGDDNDILLHGVFFANFDAGRPCQLLIPNHSIVADGYGYEDQVPYVHLNMGWADQNDIWYNLPDMTKAGGSFNEVQRIAYNIFPEIGGVTKQGQTTHAILSGRVLRHDGVPFAGATVKVKTSGKSDVVATVTSSATGVWAAILPAGTYDLLAEAADGAVTAEKTGVELTVPTTKIDNSYEGSPCVDASGDALPPGNSWGNDLVLSEEVVESAVWTGKGDRAKLDDPANWVCRNPSGETIPDAVPSAGSTAVFVTGETSFSFPVGSTPVWKSLTVTGAVTLTADCDWRGLGDVCGGLVDAGATINLRGHELRVAAAGNPVRSIGVTDDSPQGKGGHLYVDVGARVVQQGERVIAWTAKPAAGVSFRIVGSRIRENLLPRAAADGLYYDLSDPAVVSDATWTGGGDRAKLDDPRNWICMNARGETLPNAVPSAGTTAAVVTGETSFSFPVGSTPVWKSLTMSGGVTLTADCDWRGLGNACGGFIAAGVTINLKGHELRVAAEGNPGGRVNVTDNSPQGEGGRFRIDVAAGKTFSNRGESDNSWNSDRMFWFSGSVECVKDGAGTYVPANAYDPTSPDDKWMAYAHTGGTTVHEGLLRMNNDDENGNDTRFAQNHRPVFGAYGSDLRIDAGGTLDYRGVYDIWHYKTYLNGGTIRNTRKPGNLSWDAFGDLSFEADSSFDIARTAQLGGYFHLNGHTLTATIAKDQDWYCKDGSGENGTIVIRGEGTFHSYGHLIDAPTVTFDVATAMSVDMEMTVKDYIARYEGAVKGSGTAALNVVGTFRPVTQNFYPCTMRNGSTIDLSAKAGTWNSTGAFGSVRYASGATVTVDVGARALQPGERVIAWTAKPAEGVSFRLVGSGILSNLTPQIKADGLYYDLVLADDCDWRGTAAPVSGRVDLNGHKLTLSTLAGLEAVTGAGELHLFVPAGETVTDADLPLSGALKLVKEGAGTYVASRTGQSYTGGTVIRAGLCETPAGTGHSADPATNERYLGAVGSEVRVEGGSLYIRGDYNHKVYDIVSRGGAVRIESMADEGSPILLEAAPETSMSWHTLTAAKNQTITWEWPERALSARLTAKPSVGKTVSEVLTDRSVCTCAFNPALPGSAESERTYTLRLDFFATLDATGTPIAGESLTAENIGVVRGVDGAAGDLIGRGAEDPEWDDVYGRSVVLPIPAGSTSLSVNGEPVEPELDGSFGWRAIRPFVNKRICNLLLEGAEPAEATLTGHNVMPTVLIVR